jgi:hypothetical protein
MFIFLDFMRHPSGWGEEGRAAIAIDDIASIWTESVGGLRHSKIRLKSNPDIELLSISSPDEILSFIDAEKARETTWQK